VKHREPIQFEFFTAVTEVFRRLGHKGTVPISQETHYVSTTEPSQLMLCKIWGFHGSDYEECLLRYKNPVRTSQETQYVSATESSPLMLCKIWGFHGGDYEEWRLLGYKNPVCTSQETHYLHYRAQPVKAMERVERINELGTALAVACYCQRS
jgi:hypothetical protein